MIKWLRNIVGQRSEYDKVVANDLHRLNARKPGLGDQAAAYVRTGNGETVLSTVAAYCKSNELEVCQLYTRNGPASDARHHMFARAHPYPAEQIQRYAEVLTIAGGNALQQAPGTTAVPAKIRVFFGEAFLGLADRNDTWPRTVKPLNGKGITLETALDMVRRLGGREIDFIDVIYSTSPGYAAIDGELYRPLIDLPAFVALHSEAAILAAKRMPAGTKATFIRDLVAWQFNKNELFVRFLVTLAGDGSKAVREAATAALSDVAAGVLEPLAMPALAQGDIELRAAMVGLLGRLQTPTALEALRSHRKTEKAARVAAAIDVALAIADSPSIPQGGDDDATGYAAIDGQRVEIPVLRPLADGQRPVFGDADRKALRNAIIEQNARIKKSNEESARQRYHFKTPLIAEGLGDVAISILNGEPRATRVQEVSRMLNSAGSEWMRAALVKMPDKQALPVAASLFESAQRAVSSFSVGAGPDWLREFLKGPDGDIRHIEAIDIEAGSEFPHGGWPSEKKRPLQRGDYLRTEIRDDYYSQSLLTDSPRSSIWPYLAENLEVFDEAFGLKADVSTKLNRAAAIRLLRLLPATPARYFAPLLEVATGVTRYGRAEARLLLGKRPEVEQRLVALLDDSRQSIRAGAAEWLAERRDPSAAKALWGRLKIEKSELARAAILTGLRDLGEDVLQVLGPVALVGEAEKGLKSTKLDKLEWLDLQNLPRVRFRGGESAPNEMIRWWIALALKLKQPGGNALFSLYLDQLETDDAIALSTWILDAWINHDTVRPNEMDANAYAKANASNYYNMYVTYIKDYSEALAFAQLRHEYMSKYPNSGAESKGILALAVRAPSAVAADRVRSYLKSHGQRTSQASALLEMLAAIGDAVALQVVIAAATRLKQKGVQKFAGELVTKIAEARDWTVDELADRTIPTAGFDEDGILVLPCGEDAKPYEARLSGELTAILRNPAGKEIAALPPGTDEATAASKKQLSTTKKELKQIISMQTARLYEALCAERAWSASDWLRSFHEHPVMRRLVERVVWLGINEQGQVAGAFRPTAEGDFTDETDAPVDVSKFASVRLAHGALLGDAAVASWMQHLKDYEIKPLFIQFGRALLKVSPELGIKTEIDDRKGWLTDAFTVRGAAAKLGYERGPTLDGGFFNEYRKTFQSAGLAAVVEFTGNCLPEENVPAALLTLKFEKLTAPGRFGGVVKLQDAPPVLVSECWNDYRAMAAKGVYDPDWEKRSPW